MDYQLICKHVEDVLATLQPRSWRMLFMDPPDAINLKYGDYDDNRSAEEYLIWLEYIMRLATNVADITWMSYNAKWTFEVGRMVCRLIEEKQLLAKPCAQVITFGQHNQHDLGNNHRPLVRLMYSGVELYPDAIRVPSWRQEHGDKRADPRGRVPGDVFLMPRVTGNSKQRRRWIPTQLHEDLVERCIKLSCGTEDAVIDAFSGSGTVMRVCKRLGISCMSIEIDKNYCEHIAEENGLIVTYV
jgi:site-specific DNA-methyltransferase (adenine-specific)